MGSTLFRLPVYEKSGCQVPVLAGSLIIVTELIKQFAQHFQISAIKVTIKAIRNNKLSNICAKR